MRFSLRPSRRLLSGVGANLYGQVVTIAVQLVSLPVFLHFWGARTYGEWLILSAVPAYFSMSDVGMVAVAMNKMTMLLARGEKRAANAVFQSVCLLTLSATAAIAALAALVIWVLDVGALDTLAKKAVLLLLLLVALGNVVNGLFEAALVATGRYANAIFCTNTARLVEWLAGLTALAMGGHFLAVASCMFAGRLGMSLFLWMYVRASATDFTWGFRAASIQELRALALPAVSFMAFPLGYALSIQGLTLLVGGVFGPVMLATFNTYRTMSRVVVQLIAVFSHALWPEFSRLYGTGSKDALEHTYARANVGALLLTLAVAAVLALAAPYLLHAWTGGKIPYERSLFMLFLLCTIVGGLWHLPRVLLMSTNQHGHLSVCFLVLSGLVIPLAWAFPAHIGLSGPVLATLLLEIGMATVSFALARRLLHAVPSTTPLSARPQLV